MDQLQSSNLLLASLPPQELARLRPDLEPMSAQPRDVLAEADQPLDYAYFPTAGYCSIISTNGDIRVETGLIGREGFIGAPLLLRIDHSPFLLLAQEELSAVRIAKPRFLAALEQCPVFMTQLLRYIHIFTLQAAHTALANAHFKIEERLARWLCMCHDRADGNEFTMTHEFLGIMLAVRRSGITDALHDLEGKHIIRSARGSLTIIDRARLEEAANGSYGIPEAEYERVLLPMRQHLGTQRA